MRKLFIIALICSLRLAAYSQDTATLKVVVKKFDHSKGTLKVALYNTSEYWMKKSFRQTQTILKDAEEAVIYFTEIPKGEYAISLYHDENDNDDLDANAFGIPTEDYAFSNNAKGMFGPAGYQDAAFSVLENETLHVITLN